MDLFGFIKSRPRQSMDSSDIVARYQRLRPIRLRLNNELVRRLSRDALDEGAKKLGILRNGMFVFDSEDEASVLMDYCVYDVYRKNRNAVDQYLRDCPPDPDSEELACLHAMQQATYSLVAALRIEPGVGCQVRNLFTDQTQLLADVGFSKTAQPGVLMATRLLDFGDFVTTSGVALPVGVLNDDELIEWERRLRAGKNAHRFDPAPLIRACLQRGASSHVRYEELNPQRRSDDGAGVPPTGISAQGRRALEKPRTSKPMMNRRCRCGSGKMFKNCCGKRKGPLQEGSQSPSSQHDVTGCGRAE